MPRRCSPRAAGVQVIQRARPAEAADTVDRGRRVEKVYNVMLPVLPKEAQPSANCGRGRLRWAGRDAIRRPTAGNGVESEVSAALAVDTSFASDQVRSSVVGTMALARRFRHGYA